MCFNKNGADVESGCGAEFRYFLFKKIFGLPIFVSHAQKISPMSFSLSFDLIFLPLGVSKSYKVFFRLRFVDIYIMMVR